MISLVGARLRLDVGPAAHGGHCVAKHEGRVVFVRHALPGEFVEAVVTEERSAYLRADAVEVLTASPDRVTPPCPYARPGRCGGCDWQHAAPATQRQLKRDVVRELFARMAGTDVSHLLREVEELPGGPLGWRTRIEYAVASDGTPGLRRYRSHEVEPVRQCVLGARGVGDAPLLGERWPGLTGVSAVRGDGREVTVLARRPGPGRHARGQRPPDQVEVVSGPPRVKHRIGPHEYTVRADGFWQVHPHAASTYTRAVLDLLRPAAGEHVLELYAGAGALTAPLAAAVGATGRVVGLETSPTAVADAEGNLAAYPWAEVRRARVDAASITAASRGGGRVVRPDLVVLDPPRAGAGTAATRALLALGPRAVAYVSCDPASLARDVKTAQADGWRLEALRAFDAYPMTHHVECIALLVLGGARGQTRTLES
ncbi:MAG: class I SAM-dependent RNA methyltransferase [Jatrophihabitans sp.]|uniref:class I SAM-dependent RNA methyltransferase n=1 Tax=Jatrophihabitans sp. TaxID=1932789 RepID=UPI003F7EA5BC